MPQSNAAATEAAECLLQMEGIGKAFSGTTVLDNVNFDLLAGEVHILAGENGAGKSTLIKILAGVHSEYEGAVYVEGARVAFRSAQDARLRGIAVIHQELSLIPTMSVSDNIFLAREDCGPLGGVRQASQRRACQEFMQRLGLDIDVCAPAGSFPISVQQRIEIAKALSVNARIIVMDEPTSALTEPEVDRLFDTIAGLTKGKCGVIYISHKMEEIYRIADRITVLRDGELIGTETAGRLPREKLVQWMVGRPLGEQYPRHTSSGHEERLRIEDLSLPAPNGQQILDRVSLTLGRGEILGLAGLQGSGASELLWALFGASRVSPGGRIWLDGTPYVPRNPRQSIRSGIALLTNDRKTSGLVLGMDVVRNITLASFERHSPGGWILREQEYNCAEEERATLGIVCASLEQTVESLSGGNQQKVALGKWIETHPKLLLLDEPTRGVDVGAKQEIYGLMNRWTKAGISILLITSEMPELLAMSDRIIVLHRGRVTAEFDRAEATQERVLQAAMGREETSAVN